MYIISLTFVVSISAVNCLERLIAEMTHIMCQNIKWDDKLHSIHLFTNSQHQQLLATLST